VLRQRAVKQAYRERQQHAIRAAVAVRDGVDSLDTTAFNSKGCLTCGTHIHHKAQVCAHCGTAATKTGALNITNGTATNSIASRDAQNSRSQTLLEQCLHAADTRDEWEVAAILAHKVVDGTQYYKIRCYSLCNKLIVRMVDGSNKASKACLGSPSTS
jgi:predicted amidophosphoribosyltransferase